MDLSIFRYIKFWGVSSSEAFWLYTSVYAMEDKTALNSNEFGIKMHPLRQQQQQQQ
jgi:hypothetical protein